MVVNNAGFGLFGEFASTSLEEELRMIDTNIRAVHILTKLAVRDFAARGRGYVFECGVLGRLSAGPLMATYYATKNYVLRLTEAIREELRRAGSPVKVCALCPGPVDTEFNKGGGRAVFARRPERATSGARGGQQAVRGQGRRCAGRGDESHDHGAPLRARLPARARHLSFSAQEKRRMTAQEIKRTLLARICAPAAPAVCGRGPGNTAWCGRAIGSRHAFPAARTRCCSPCCCQDLHARWTLNWCSFAMDRDTRPPAARLEENAARLALPLGYRHQCAARRGASRGASLLSVRENAARLPVRRGAEARCNKIALSHHYDDAIENRAHGLAVRRSGAGHAAAHAGEKITRGWS